MCFLVFFSSVDVVMVALQHNIEEECMAVTVSDSVSEGGRFGVTLGSKTPSTGHDRKGKYRFIIEFGMSLCVALDNYLFLFLTAKNTMRLVQIQWTCTLAGSINFRWSPTTD